MNKVLAKTLLASALLAVSAAAVAQFQPNMSAAALNAEIKALKQANAPADAIVTMALASGSVTPGNVALLADAMLSQGIPASETISSLIAAFGATDQVVNAVVASARAAGVPANVITTAAISSGAAPSLVTSATAAGPAQSQGSLQGATPTQNVGQSTSGFSSSFGSSGTSGFSSSGGGGVPRVSGS